MGGHFLGIAIEALVAVLLAVTIGYCVLVNRKLVHLRSDQSELKTIVRDLHMATNQAEQAISGLRQGASIAEESLVRQIDHVRGLDAQLSASINRGEALLTKFAAMPRMQPGRGQPASGADCQVQENRQSLVGLGLENTRRRNEAARTGGQGVRDEAAA